MKILIFAIRNCVGCQTHLKEIYRIATLHQTPVRFYDLDDPKTFMMTLSAMRKYGLQKTPSTAIVDTDGNLLFSIGGMGDEIVRKTEEFFSSFL